MEQMSRQGLAELARAKRVSQIADRLIAAANDGLYEIRLPQMFPEQIEYVKAHGLTYRAIEQKDGTEHEIKWD